MPHISQSLFAQAVLDAAAPVPEGLVAWNSPIPQRRFGVYRNNVAIGLGAALASRFPIAEKIVGADFFAAMARVYIDQHPPRSPLLLAYGDDFADFVATFAPAAEITYLADIIRLEAARSRAYHAADRAPLDPGALAGIAPQDLPKLVFEAHPSATVLCSTHPIVTIWAMNGGDLPLQPIADWRGEAALVVRPDLTVNVHRLTAGGAVFVSALLSGVPLGTAVQRAIDDDPGFDLSANLAGILRAGALTNLSCCSGDDHEQS